MTDIGIDLTAWSVAIGFSLIAFGGVVERLTGWTTHVWRKR